MELYQLKSFMEITATRNLTRASQNLNISQSALSSQIRQLEEELGVNLFRRSARGMNLSEEGRVLYSYAEDVVRAAQTMHEKADELCGKVLGTFRIGLNTDGAFLKVGKLNRALNAAFPDVNFVLVSSQTIRTAEMLRQGLIDIGFFFGDCQDSGIDSATVSSFRIAVVIPSSILPEGSHIDWQTAASLPWIWSVCDCPYYQIVQEELNNLELEPRKIVDAMDESVVRKLVLDGQGLAILREDEAQAVVATGAAWMWDNIRFTLPLRLGWLNQNSDMALLDKVRETIISLWETDHHSPPPYIPDENRETSMFASRQLC